MAKSAFSRFAWFLLAYTGVVALWGAFVRATGSGAGCGSHWPLCNGAVLPKSPQVETLIELTHRLTSGLYGFLVLGLVIWALRRFGRRHRVSKGALVVLGLTAVEVLVGAGLVKFELVAENDSMARAYVMSVHLVTTFALIAAMTLTALWASGLGRLKPRQPNGLRRWLYPSIGLTLLVGVSGAIAALGDTLFPANTFVEGLMQDLSATAHVFVRLRIWHPLLAVAAALLLVTTALAIRYRRTQPITRRLAKGLTTIVVVQIAAGLLNLILAAPVWMQIVHLLLAYGLWVVLVSLTAVCIEEDELERIATAEPSVPPSLLRA